MCTHIFKITSQPHSAHLFLYCNLSKNIKHTCKKNIRKQKLSYNSPHVMMVNQKILYPARTPKTKKLFERSLFYFLEKNSPQIGIFLYIRKCIFYLKILCMYLKMLLMIIIIIILTYSTENMCSIFRRKRFLECIWRRTYYEFI